MTAADRTEREPAGIALPGTSPAGGGKDALETGLRAWLLGGDVSIQYQVRRDLLDEDDPLLRARIANQGWGARFLACRNPDGSWGRGFYQPKWTSSHYTLLDLKTLGIAPDHPVPRESVNRILAAQWFADGGIGPARSIGVSDVCVNGMFLNYASYFGAPEASLRRIVDFILAQWMEDGGFNCWRNRSGARHSSMDSTLSVLEGLHEYAANGYGYRREELERASAAGREFLLRHRLFRSERSGEVIRDDMLRLCFPPRWKFNILRALDYFRSAAAWDDRMTEALAIVRSKCREGRWLLPAPHPGQVHFVMEQPGAPSRWNTLIALRVLRACR
ncbi:prenyltransferase/squalene oxidase repeat-containing protein [Sphingomonas caeni]|uniref:hypothetical protein n=1 Tax=Sphingomonas caeni TaxID=2984949 RepID=UPI00223001E8|nr:hypothetical protein [Sphingomonas caeni]